MSEDKFEPIKSRDLPPIGQCAFCVYTGERHGWVCPIMTEAAKPHMDRLVERLGTTMQQVLGDAASAAVVGVSEEDLCRTPSCVELSFDPLCVMVGHLPEFAGRFGIAIVTASEAAATHLRQMEPVGSA